MTDTKALRERYAITPPVCPVCGHTLESQAAGNGLDSFWCPAAVTPKIEVEHYTRSLQTLPSGYKPGDPAVLALCDEAEALRAQVAAAPEVLREWPKTEEEAPGEWAHFTADEGIRVGRFLNLPHMGGHVVTFERSGNRTIRLPDDFRPGEFFVRVP